MIWRIRQVVYYIASVTALGLSVAAFDDGRTVWQLIAACWCLASFVQPTWNEAARARNVMLLALSLASCTGSAHRECDIDGPRAAPWIVQCAAAANPKSDEEGEDLVRQCEETARELFCVARWRWRDNHGDKVWCADGDQSIKQECRARGWDGAR